MGFDEVYEAVKGIAIVAAFTFDTLAMVSLALSKNNTDILSSIAFLIIALFFSLEIWVVLNTKWKI